MDTLERQFQQRPVTQGQIQSGYQVMVNSPHQNFGTISSQPFMDKRLKLRERNKRVASRDSNVTKSLILTEQLTSPKNPQTLQRHRFNLYSPAQSLNLANVLELQSPTNNPLSPSLVSPLPNQHSTGLGVNDNKANDFTMYFKEKIRKEKREAKNRIKEYKRRNQKMMQSLPVEEIRRVVKQGSQKFSGVLVDDQQSSYISNVKKRQSQEHKLQLSGSRQCSTVAREDIDQQRSGSRTRQKNNSEKEIEFAFRLNKLNVKRVTDKVGDNLGGDQSKLTKMQQKFKSEYNIKIPRSYPENENQDVNTENVESPCPPIKRGSSKKIVLQKSMSPNRLASADVSPINGQSGAKIHLSSIQHEKIEESKNEIELDQLLDQDKNTEVKVGGGTVQNSIQDNTYNSELHMSFVNANLQQLAVKETARLKSHRNQSLTNSVTNSLVNSPQRQDIQQSSIEQTTTKDENQKNQLNQDLNQNPGLKAYVNRKSQKQNLTKRRVIKEMPQVVNVSLENRDIILAPPHMKNPLSVKGIKNFDPKELNFQNSPKNPSQKPKKNKELDQFMSVMTGQFQSRVHQLKHIELSRSLSPQSPKDVKNHGFTSRKASLKDIQHHGNQKSDETTNAQDNHLKCSRKLKGAAQNNYKYKRHDRVHQKTGSYHSQDVDKLIKKVSPQRNEPKNSIPLQVKFPQRRNYIESVEIQVDYEVTLENTNRTSTIEEGITANIPKSPHHSNIKEIIGDNIDASTVEGKNSKEKSKRSHNESIPTAKSSMLQVHKKRKSSMVHAEMTADEISYSNQSKRGLQSRGRQDTLNSNIISDTVLVISPKHLNEKPPTVQQKITRKQSHQKQLKEKTRRIALPSNDLREADQVITALGLGPNELITQTQSTIYSPANEPIGDFNMKSDVVIISQFQPQADDQKEIDSIMKANKTSLIQDQVIYQKPKSTYDQATSKATFNRPLGNSTHSRISNIHIMAKKNRIGLFNQNQMKRKTDLHSLEGPIIGKEINISQHREFKTKFQVKQKQTRMRNRVVDKHRSGYHLSGEINKDIEAQMKPSGVCTPEPEIEEGDLAIFMGEPNERKDGSSVGSPTGVTQNRYASPMEGETAIVTHLNSRYNLGALQPADNCRLNTIQTIQSIKEKETHQFSPSIKSGPSLKQGASSQDSCYNVKTIQFNQIIDQFEHLSHHNKDYKKALLFAQTQDKHQIRPVQQQARQPSHYKKTEKIQEKHETTDSERIKMIQVGKIGDNGDRDASQEAEGTKEMVKENPSDSRQSIVDELEKFGQLISSSSPRENFCFKGEHVTSSITSQGDIGQTKEGFVVSSQHQVVTQTSPKDNHDEVYQQAKSISTRNEGLVSKESIEKQLELRQEESLVVIANDRQETVQTIAKVDESFDFGRNKRPKLSPEQLRTEKLEQVKEAKALQIINMDHSQGRRNKVINEMRKKRIFNGTSPLRHVSNQEKSALSEGEASPNESQIRSKALSQQAQYPQLIMSGQRIKSTAGKDQANSVHKNDASTLIGYPETRNQGDYDSQQDQYAYDQAIAQEPSKDKSMATNSVLNTDLRCLTSNQQKRHMQQRGNQVAFGNFVEQYQAQGNNGQQIDILIPTQFPERDHQNVTFKEDLKLQKNYPPSALHQNHIDQTKQYTNTRYVVEAQTNPNDSQSAGNLPLSDSNEDYYSRTYLDGTLKDVKEVLQVIKQSDDGERSQARTPATLKSNTVNQYQGDVTDKNASRAISPKNFSGRLERRVKIPEKVQDEIHQNKKDIGIQQDTVDEELEQAMSGLQKEAGHDQDGRSCVTRSLILKQPHLRLQLAKSQKQRIGSPFQEKGPNQIEESSSVFKKSKNQSNFERAQSHNRVANAKLREKATVLQDDCPILKVSKMEFQKSPKALQFANVEANLQDVEVQSERNQTITLDKRRSTLRQESGGNLVQKSKNTVHGVKITSVAPSPIQSLTLNIEKEHSELTVIKRQSDFNNNDKEGIERTLSEYERYSAIANSLIPVGQQQIYGGQEKDIILEEAKHGETSQNDANNQPEVYRQAHTVTMPSESFELDCQDETNQRDPLIISNFSNPRQKKKIISHDKRQNYQEKASGISPPQEPKFNLQLLNSPGVPLAMGSDPQPNQNQPKTVLIFLSPRDQDKINSGGSELVKIKQMLEQEKQNQMNNAGPPQIPDGNFVQFSSMEPYKQQRTETIPNGKPIWGNHLKNFAGVQGKKATIGRQSPTAQINEKHKQFKKTPIIQVSEQQVITQPNQPKVQVPLKDLNPSPLIPSLTRDPASSQLRDKSGLNTTHGWRAPSINTVNQSMVQMEFMESNNSPLPNQNQP